MAFLLFEGIQVSLIHLFIRRPDYLETSIYARNLLNRFILQLVATNEVAIADAAEDSKSNRAAVGQKMVMEETRKLITKYLEVERTALEYNHTYTDELLHAKFAGLLKELLNGFYSLDPFHLYSMPWITPILLGGISCKKEEILTLTQRLVTRVSSTPERVPKEKVSADNEMVESLAVPQLTDPDVMSDSPVADAEGEKHGDDGLRNTNDDEAVLTHGAIETSTDHEKDETAERPKDSSYDDGALSETMGSKGNSVVETEEHADSIAKTDELREAAKDNESGLNFGSRNESVGSLIKEAEV